MTDNEDVEETASTSQNLESTSSASAGVGVVNTTTASSGGGSVYGSNRSVTSSSSRGAMALGVNDEGEVVGDDLDNDVDDDDLDQWIEDTVESSNSMRTEETCTTAATATTTAVDKIPSHTPASTVANSSSSPKKASSSSSSSSSVGGYGRRLSDGKSGNKRESFTAETPYFGAYVDRELRHLTILSETLYDISARARSAGQKGAEMARASRKLSSACKLHPTYDRNGDDWINATDDDEEGKSRERRIQEARNEAVGKEMGHVLRILGEVLDEIADAQVLMCESLEASLSVTLEAFANVELEQVTKLKMDAEKQTTCAENMLSRYLQRCSGLTDVKALMNAIGNNSNSSSSSNATTSISSSVDDLNATVQAAVTSNWKNISDQVSFFGRGGGASRNKDASSQQQGGHSNHNRQQQQQLAGANGDGNGFRRRARDLRSRGSGGRNDEGALVAGSSAAPNNDELEMIERASASATMRKMLEEIRLSQSHAELKRFQLLRRLDSLKTRRNYELGESAIASLNGIRAYFHHCSDITQSLSPRLKSAQGEQNVSRERHAAQQKPWEKCEASLENAIQTVDASVSNAAVIADAIRDESSSELGRQLIESRKGTTTLADIEEEADLWNLPQMLANCSLYYREPKAGVIVEGWLYKKTTTRITSTWAKRWFILDKTGVYYMRQAEDFHNLANNHQSSSTSKSSSATSKRELVKVCDILLCTVRELPETAKGNNGCRFCFEIISPNHKPYLLQAIGPIEYKRWVQEIRSCIEKQLVLGKVHPSTLTASTSNNGSGTPRSLQHQKSVAVLTEGKKVSSYLDDFLNANLVLNPFAEEGEEAPPSSQALKQLVESPKRDKPNFIQELLTNNPNCADCGKPNPDWASLNLGVMLCIECSGIHRSLGVHVSKIRSVRLDDISKTESLLLRSIGNQKANRVWEAGISHQTGWTKPGPSDDRKRKEDYIKSKYQWKGFIDYSDESSSESERMETYSLALYDAAKVGDLMSTMVAMAKGGSPEWNNLKEEGKTALHACALGQTSSESSLDDYQRKKQTLKSIVCAEFLLQNGAKMDAMDQHDHSVLDCAVCNNAQREMIEFLTTRSI